MFALAAIAAGAFMAFLGASSASATSLEEVVLCKTLPAEGANCPEKGHFGSGTVVHGLAENPVLLGAFNIECLHSKTSGKLTSLLAHGVIESLSFTHCLRTSNGNTCTTTTERLPYLIQAELAADHKAYEVLVKAGESGLRPEVRVQCPSDGIDCKYGADHIKFSVLHVELVVLDVLQELTGLGFCFITAVWHAKYKTKCLEGTSEVGCYPAMEEKAGPL
jgi:hypothetical protein